RQQRRAGLVGEYPAGRREDHRAGFPHHPIPSALRLGVAHQLTGLIASPDRPASWPRGSCMPALPAASTPKVNRPGGNVTGVTFLVTALGAKRLELLRELVPSAKLVGFPDYRHAGCSARARR